MQWSRTRSGSAIYSISFPSFSLADWKYPVLFESCTIVLVFLWSGVSFMKQHSIFISFAGSTMKHLSWCLKMSASINTERVGNLFIIPNWRVQWDGFQQQTRKNWWTGWRSVVLRVRLRAQKQIPSQHQHHLP